MGMDPFSWVAIGIAALSAGTSAYSANKQEKAQKSAMRQAEANAKKQEEMAAQEQNRLNQKRADVGGLLSAAEQAGKAGVSGTMLTGPQGVNMDDLSLGKNKLLGQ